MKIILFLIVLISLLAVGIKYLSGIWSVVAPSEVNITNTSQPTPSGFRLSIFAKDLVDPRVMIRDQNNILVSIPSQGKVVAISIKNSTQKTILEGLNKPHGLAFLCHNQCQLYVAETGGVVAYDYDPQTAGVSNRKKILDLPSGGNHFTRTIMFDQNNKLLVAIGSTCNVCQDDPPRAAIWSANSDGTDFKPFATGLRNSVFMTTNPTTGEIWATEMGRDLLGDDIPPDEINIIQEGRDYGWPNCYGNNIADTSFNKSANCAGKEPSHIDLQAHSAPLGLAFLGQDLLVSFHGSWNRTVPTGYKVVKIKLDKSGKYLGVEDFLSGWLQNGNALGRPVDIMVDKGNIYISDDKGGVIYKLTPN